MVALVRLPYLWGGFFNYFFSVSDVGATQCLVGNALGFVGGGFLALACAFLVMIVVFMPEGESSRGPLLYLTAMFSAIPCMLADDPANVSSDAQRLRGILNRIINHDLSLDPIVTPLLTTLARENNDQGIGALARCLCKFTHPR